MRSNRKPPARAACLTCREAKIRCDGRQPCGRCSARNLTCSYRPSQRGGIRRGARHSLQYVAAPPPSFQQTEPPFLAGGHAFQQNSPFLDEVLGIYDPESAIHLLAPFRGIQNLNVQSGAIGDNFAPASQNDHENHDAESLAIRSYTSDDDILSAYYVYIHPFLPILPPPASTTQCHDVPISISPQNFPDGPINRDSLPHWPTTSLTLAISAILVLIPLPRKSHPNQACNAPLRRSQAHLFAKTAFEEVESEIERNTRAQTSGAFSELTSSNLPSRLHPILALSILSVYEYCQRGSISRMRSRANEAVTAAMDLSLHTLDERSTEAERRTWWSTMLVLYLSSIDLQIVGHPERERALYFNSAELYQYPIISISDPRIITPFPSFQGSTELWSFVLETEQSLISVLQTFNGYIGKFPTSTLRSESPEKIIQLDSHLSSLSKRSACLIQPTSRGLGSADVIASQNMRSISTLFIDCARIRLHRARAFKEIPMFLGKYCGLASIDDERGPNTGFDSPQSQYFDSFFPFSEEASSLICLRSALAMSRGLESLSLTRPSRGGSQSQFIDQDKSSAENGVVPFLLPFFVCTVMQSSYVLLMCHYRLRAALVSRNIASCHYLLNNPAADSEVQEVERLMREIRQGLESIIDALRGAKMFEGVGGMSKEIHIACQSAVMGR